MDAIKNNLTLAGPSLGNDVASFVLSQHTFPPRYGPSQSDDKLSHEEMRRESQPAIHPSILKMDLVRIRWWSRTKGRDDMIFESASSAGLLVSIADFMGPKSRGSIKLQTESYVAVPFGAGGMSSLGCFMSGSESMELAQQGKSLISYLLAAIAMGTRKHGLANSFILSHL
ncbi:hypothetical protein D5086_023715 [Populus alba]|uniref:Uncharacterized protein n=1 Tax=Populus alba TaxID=43335 RepID=A0ACC4BB14_POPAL